MKLHAAIAFLTLTATATADVLLTKKIVTDEVVTPNGTRPPREDTQTIWLGKDRVRAESGPITYIVRLDQQKLFVVNANDRTYSALALPVDLKSYVTPEELPAFEQAKTRLNISATVVPTGEVERLKGWSASKFKVQITSLGASSEETYWTTKDIEVDWNTFWESQRAVRSLQLGTEAMQEQMRRLDGVTVKVDRTRTTAMGKEHVVEELVSAERKEAPAGIYDVPPDYKEKPFNGMSAVRAAMGPRPNAGPGDAPPAEKGGRRGEEKPPEPKRGGDEKPPEPKRGG